MVHRTHPVQWLGAQVMELCLSSVNYYLALGRYLKIIYNIETLVGLL